MRTSIDLRRRGDDFEVARAEAGASVSEQLAKAEPPPPPRSVDTTAPRLSLRGRGSGARARLSSLPPELLSLGVVETQPRGIPTIPEHGDNDVQPPIVAATASARSRQAREWRTQARQARATGRGVRVAARWQAAARRTRAKKGAGKGGGGTE